MRHPNFRRRQGPLACLVASTLLAACAAPDVTSPALARAPSILQRGGGGGGGGSVVCSNIEKFEAIPGYYPGNKTWGAVWINVSFKSCDGTSVTATIKGTQTSAPGPDRSYLPALGSTGFQLGSPDSIAYTLTSGTTIDWEPVELESQFLIALDIRNASGDVIETRSVSVVTPAPVISSTTP